MLKHTTPPYFLLRASIASFLIVLGLTLGSTKTVHAIAYFSSTTVSGPVGDGDDSGASLAIDSAENIYVTGFVDTVGQGKDLWIGKFNSSLALISSITINGQSSDDDEGFGIAIDSSDNIFVTGYVDKGIAEAGNLWVGKFNTSLVLQSSVTVNGSAAGSFDRGYAATIDHAGNVVVAGILTETLGGQNLFVGKLTAALVWISSTTKIVDAGPGSASEGLHGVAVDSVNNIYAVGFNDFSGSNKILIMKFSPALAVLANSDMSGLSQPEIAYGITVDGSDNIYVTGSRSNSIWVGKFNTSLGFVTQANTISNGSGRSLINDSSDNLYVTGKYTTGTSIWVGKYNPDLSLVSSNTISGTVSGPNVGGYGIRINGSDLYIGGQNYAIWLGKASPPDTPSFSGVALGISSITWSWNNVNGETSFQIYSSTGGAISPSINANVTSWTETNLSAGTSYTRRVRVINELGYSESSLQSVSTSESGPSSPTGFAGTTLGTSSITWSWTDVSGETSYQVFSDTDGAISPLIAANNVTWTETGLTANTSYTRYVKASNSFGSSSSTTDTETTSSETTEVSSTITEAGGTITYHPTSGDIDIVFPAGSVTASRTVTVQSPASFAQSISPTIQLTGTGIGIQIDLDQNIQPAKRVTIIIRYRPSDIVGLQESELIIARYDSVSNVWVPLQSTVDTTLRKVTATTDHFSTFQLMAATPANSVANAKVFPNPFRPSQGHSLITFSNITASAMLRIYAFDGEKVQSLQADSSGLASWDAKNESREPVASGVYFVVIEGGGDKKTLKVAIQR